MAKSGRGSVNGATITQNERVVGEMDCESVIGVIEMRPGKISHGWQVTFRRHVFHATSYR